MSKETLGQKAAEELWGCGYLVDPEGENGVLTIGGLEEAVAKIIDDLAAQRTCGCEKLRDFIKAYFMYGVRRFPDGRNYRDHAKELLAQPCSCQQAPILGPTGEHKCPKCGNSFQNAIPDGSPDWLRCATCKHVWWQTPASAGSEEWHIEKGGGLVMDRGHTIQYMASAMAISIADAHNAALRRISAPTVEAWRDLDDKEEPRDDDRFITVWQTDGDGRACRQRRVSAPQSSDKTASVGRQTNE